MEEGDLIISMFLGAFTALIGFFFQFSRVKSNPSETPKICIQLEIALLLLLHFHMIDIFIMGFKKDEAMNRWPTAPASLLFYKYTKTSSEAGFCKFKYECYIGSRTFVHEGMAGTAHCRSIKAKNNSGHLTCLYNPNNPEESLLWITPKWIYLLTGLVVYINFILFALIFLFIFYSKEFYNDGENESSVLNVRNFSILASIRKYFFKSFLFAVMQGACFAFICSFLPIPLLRFARYGIIVPEVLLFSSIARHHHRMWIQFFEY